MQMINILGHCNPEIRNADEILEWWDAKMQCILWIENEQLFVHNRLILCYCLQS